MEWQGISEFVAVAQTQSFTQAAQKLNVSTAHVSRHINALESRLNIKLFYRTTRNVSLTQEGEIFYHRCHHILNELQEAQLALTNLQSKPQGHIKLTAPITFGEQIVLPLVNDFSVHYPDVTVQAHLTNKRIDIIEEGFDLAIRIGALEDSSLIATKLSSRRNYLCASPTYIEQHGHPQTINELQHHNCLLGSQNYWRLKDGNKVKQIQVKGTHQYNNGYALLDAVKKDLGIAQLPQYYVDRYLTQNELIVVLESHQEPQENIWAVRPHNRQLSPKIKSLIDYLQQQINSPDK